MEDGGLHPLSQVGAFTLRRLRLNRPALLVNRLQRRRILDELQLLARYRDLVHVLESLMIQQTALIEEQQSLLKEQSELLKLLIDKR